MNHHEVDAETHHFFLGPYPYSDDPKGFLDRVLFIREGHKPVAIKAIKDLLLDNFLEDSFTLFLKNERGTTLFDGDFQILNKIHLNKEQYGLLTYTFGLSNPELIEAKYGPLKTYRVNHGAFIYFYNPSDKALVKLSNLFGHCHPSFIVEADSERLANLK